MNTVSMTRSGGQAREPSCEGRIFGREHRIPVLRMMLLTQCKRLSFWRVLLLASGRSRQAA